MTTRLVIYDLKLEKCQQSKLDSCYNMQKKIKKGACECILVSAFAHKLILYSS